MHRNFMFNQEPSPEAYAAAAAILGSLFGTVTGFMLNQQPTTGSNPYRKPILTVGELEDYLAANAHSHPRYAEFMQQLAQLPREQPLTKQLTADILN
jgi:hypothetical protein